VYFVKVHIEYLTWLICCIARKWIQILEEAGLFLSIAVFRLVLGPSYPSVQWLLGSFFLAMKQPLPEADHSAKQKLGEI
jgi:hypothetical protein